MIKQFMVVGALAATILLVVPAKVVAQEERDDFVVDHFGPGDTIYTFVNPGVLGSAEERDTASFACANIYVYQNQNPVACGSCPISANGALVFSLRRDLLAHPQTKDGGPVIRGVVKVVYTALSVNGCDPTRIGTTAPHALKTFRQRSAAATDIELDEAYLSRAETTELQDNCQSIIDVRSGTTNIGCPATEQ